MYLTDKTIIVLSSFVFILFDFKSVLYNFTLKFVMHLNKNIALHQSITRDKLIVLNLLLTYISRISI